MRTLALRNDSTPALVKESDRTAQNVNALKETSFPADLPVLTLVAQDNIDHLPVWLPAHRAQLEGLVHSQLVVIDDTHYLHYHHSPQIAGAARAFLATSVASGPEGQPRREETGRAAPVTKTPLRGRVMRRPT